MIVQALEVVGAVGLQDGLGWDDIVAYAAGAATVLTVLGVVFRRPLKEFSEFLGWWRKFSVDWDGEQPRDGRDHTPGVMERLNQIDGEFKRNGGNTMKDAMYRTERAVNEIGERLGVVEKAQKENARISATNVRVATENLEAIAQTLDALGVETPPLAPLVPPVHVETMEITADNVEITASAVTEPS